MTWESRALAHGPYVVSFGTSGSEIFTGLTEGVPRHEGTPSGIPIRSTFGGDTLLDEIYTGQNHFVTVNFKEWRKTNAGSTPVNRNTLSIMNPFADATDQTNAESLDADGHFLGFTGIIGQSKWSLASALLFTAVTGTPAATWGPLYRRYYKAIVASDSTIMASFGAVERNVSLTFRILPVLLNASQITTARFHHFLDIYP